LYGCPDSIRGKIIVQADMKDKGGKHIAFHIAALIQTDTSDANCLSSVVTN
jgi:hypothetical protein